MYTICNTHRHTSLFLVEQQPPQGGFVCDHAGLVIDKSSLGRGGVREPRWNVHHLRVGLAIRIQPQFDRSGQIQFDRSGQIQTGQTRGGGGVGGVREPRWNVHHLLGR